MNLLNPTSGRDASHPSLGQRLIRQGWEASFPSVGLSKFVWVGRKSILAYPKANNTWLGVKTKVLPQKGAFEGNAHQKYRPLWVAVFRPPPTNNYPTQKLNKNNKNIHNGNCILAKKKNYFTTKKPRVIGEVKTNFFATTVNWYKYFIKIISLLSIKKLKLFLFLYYFTELFILF